jgi:hypothetical protein
LTPPTATTAPEYSSADPDAPTDTKTNPERGFG